MDTKKFYNLSNPRDVEFLLSTINDDMAVDSDVGGDDDADDNIPSSRCSIAPSTSTSFSNQFEDSDNEDSESSEAKPPMFQGSTFDRPFGISKKAQFDITSPLSIFLNVMTNLFLQYIVDQSNLYAIQRGTVLGLTLDELKAYLGILIIMGFHTLPSIRHYWSKESNFGVQRVQSIMTLKRFLKITRMLHLNDNETMAKKRKRV
ncbi:piggyBac transposable element-derived protein 2-like [Photinus pyralis]|uniref:piggyBac transposable element-derived protein 2-like n=1 Tax=Photinus pyralis TaxID=7054 RepID=UPI001267186D|nr:piggyBac transposable element-derived protein 2-like [Photinus pyralis]